MSMEDRELPSVVEYAINYLVQEVLSNCVESLSYFREEGTNPLRTWWKSSFWSRRFSPKGGRDFQTCFQGAHQSRGEKPSSYECDCLQVEADLGQMTHADSADFQHVVYPLWTNLKADARHGKNCLWSRNLRSSRRTCLDFDHCPR
eukprot:1569849-Amphidinium_carterae.1